MSLAAADGPVLSVSALLRREGRGPHAAAGPLRPRTHLRAEGVLPVPPPRRSVRKVTVAATALFAFGAIVGPSVLDDAALPRAEAEWPSPDSAHTGIDGGAAAFSGNPFGDPSGIPLSARFLPAGLE